jgi:transaldolase / glucose-6-phosphate isomerase
VNASGGGSTPATSGATAMAAGPSLVAELGSYGAAVEARVTQWRSQGASAAIWDKDPKFWPAADPKNVATRLGWLALPKDSEKLVPELRQLAESVRSEGFRHVVLLGMGGSSLAPETLTRTLGPQPGWPELHVLDSTHPATVLRTLPKEELLRSVFVVSSKSGTTLEPNAFFQYFWSEVSRQRPSPGSQFLAITDPGTPLEQLARKHGFRRCFLAPPDVGGRYSALTPFGLVPAALVGIDVGRLLALAREMQSRCGPDVEAGTHPGLRLGAILGELGRAGRDKVILVPSGSIEALPPWLEQLIAESLGKRGTGLVPVTGEIDPLNPMGSRDRLVVVFGARGAATSSGDAGPTVSIDVPDPEDVAREFFRWEFAIASVGSILGIDPFDQPDVEIAKELAREAMAPAHGAPPKPLPGEEPVPVADPSGLANRVGVWRSSAQPGDYIAVQAFLDATESVRSGVRELGFALRRSLQLATTTGIGPRFLHSTGQLHKGGPPSGLFLQLIDEPSVDLEVPEMSLSFARILRAQADGDARVLLQRGRRLLRVQLGNDAVRGLAILRDQFGS